MRKLIAKPAFLRTVIYFLLIIAALLGVTAIKFYNDLKKERSQSTSNVSPTSPSATSQVTTVRMKDGKLTSALLLFETPEESEKLKPLKSQLQQLLETERQQGNIFRASLLVRKLVNGEWMGINPNEGFHPGSLIKVPVLITYLKQSEEEPGLLDKKLLYTTPNFAVPDQTFKDSTILRNGQSYSIRQLLFEMVAKSDNYATLLLLQHIDVQGFKKLFTSLGLPEPPEKDLNLTISADNYSKFFITLYNAGYLTIPNSEYALSILAKSNFKAGIVTGFPPGTVIAHKFGEFNNGPNKELHEAGIIYYNNSPYLIVLMTEGKDIPHLTGVFNRVATAINEGLAPGKL